jgi:hypothetical protein
MSLSKLLLPSYWMIYPCFLVLICYIYLMIYFPPSIFVFVTDGLFVFRFELSIHKVVLTDHTLILIALHRVL